MLTLMQEVRFGLKLAGMDKQAIADKFAQALEWAGLTHLSGKNALRPSVAQVLDDEHLHLCKTGPCRYTLVHQPFLSESDQERPSIPERGNPPSATLSTDTVPSPAALTAAPPGGAPDLIPKEDITGVILAGGKGRRIGGLDKGLLQVDGRPLVSHIVEMVRPQVGSLVINANRNIDSYRALGYPVVQDMVGDFFGPLAGMASAMRDSDTPYLLAVPCDSPPVPAELCAKLYRTLKAADADISVAHNGTRMQPVFVLLRRKLLPDLLSYLEKGGRKIDSWYREHRLVLADFSDRPDAFLNINTREELRTLEAVKRKACLAPPIAPLVSDK